MKFQLSSTPHHSPLLSLLSVIDKIYSGIITRWNDSLITELNPDISLPGTEILPAYRDGAVEPNLIFTRFMSRYSNETEQAWIASNDFGVGCPYSASRQRCVCLRVYWELY
jgi:hypothetical protein